MEGVWEGPGNEAIGQAFMGGVSILVWEGPGNEAIGQGFMGVVSILVWVGPGNEGGWKYTSRENASELM